MYPVIRILPALVLLVILVSSGEAQTSLTEDNPTITFGMTGPNTGSYGIQGGAAAIGVQAAFKAANRFSLIQYQLIFKPDDYNVTLSVQNARELQNYTFGFVGNFGTAANLAILEDDQMQDDVVYIAPLTGTGDLSSVSLDNVDHVFNLRASFRDEMDAIGSFLEANWNVVGSLGMVYQSDSFGSYCLSMLEYGLQNLHLSLMSKHGFNVYNLETQKGLDNEVSTAVSSLTAGGKWPGGIIFAGPGDMFAPLIPAIISHYKINGKAAPTFIAMSSASIDKLGTLLPQVETGGATIVVAALSPVPIAGVLTQWDEIVEDYVNAMGRYFPNETLTFAGMEGFLAGRFITDTIPRALEESDWPLTRDGYIDYLYENEKAVDLEGWEIGPFKNTCGNKSLSSLCWCNRGAHNIYFSQWIGGHQLWTSAKGTFFNLNPCALGADSVSAHRILLGQTADITSGSGSGLDVRIGITSAFSDAKSRQTELILASLDDAEDSAVANSRKLLNSTVGIIGMTSPAGATGVVGIVPETFPVIGTLSTELSLRRPFRRNIVNLRPSCWDEMWEYVNLFYEKLNRARIAVFRGVDEQSLDCYQGLLKAMEHHGIQLVGDAVYQEGSDVSTVLASVIAGSPNAFILIGETEPTRSFISKARIIFVNPLFGLVSWSANYLEEATSTYTPSNDTFVTLPLPPQETSDISLVTEWTKDASDTTSRVEYYGYFAGRFMSSVASLLTSDEISPAVILDTIYSVKVFDIGGISVGPFSDVCSKSDETCCNQGLSAIYLCQYNTELGGFETVPTLTEAVPYCGVDYTVPKDSSQEVAIIAGCVSGGAVLLAIAAATGFAVLWVRRDGLNELKLDAKDVHILDEIGTGRYGKVFMATWRGTEAAVRIVNLKKGAEGENSITMLTNDLLHLKKLRHPGLVMTLGYYIKGQEFCIVTEYMHLGSLENVLRRGLIFDQNSLMSIGYDVCKTLSFLHNCKPQVIHGNLTTASVLIDSKLTAKLTDCSLSGASTGSSRRNLLRFTAPELTSNLGASAITPKVDVYAFGVMLWEMFIPRDMLEKYIEAHTSTKTHSNSHSHGSGAPGSSAAKKTGSNTKASRDMFSSLTIPSSIPVTISRLITGCTATSADSRPTTEEILGHWNSILTEMASLTISLSSSRPGSRLADPPPGSPMLTASMAPQNPPPTTSTDSAIYSIGQDDQVFQCLAAAVVG